MNIDSQRYTCANTKNRLTDLRTTRATDSIAPVFSAPSFTCATTIHLQSPDPSMPTPSPAYVRPRFLLPLGGESGRAGPTSVGIGSRTRRNSGSRNGDAASCACSEAIGLVAGRSAGNGLRLTNRFNEDCCGVAVGVVLDGPGSTGSTNHGTGRSCSGVEDIERLRAAESTLEAATGVARRVLVHARSTCMSRVRMGAERFKRHQKFATWRRTLRRRIWASHATSQQITSLAVRALSLPFTPPTPLVVVDSVGKSS